MAAGSRLSPTSTHSLNVHAGYKDSTRGMADKEAKPDDKKRLLKEVDGRRIQAPNLNLAAPERVEPSPKLNLAVPLQVEPLSSMNLAVPLRVEPPPILPLLNLTAPVSVEPSPKLNLVVPLRVEPP